MPDTRRRKPQANTLAKAAPSSATGKFSNASPASQSVLWKYALLISTIFTGLILLVVLSINGGKSTPIARSVVDNSTALPFYVADLPGRGKGLLASRDIKQGELLLREKPLFIVPRQISSSPTALMAESLAGLSQVEREAFFNLSYVNFPQHLDPRKHRGEVALAIFQTNAVAAGDGVGIFPRMARLNHGCSGAFNAVYTWREKEQTLVVHALKSVKQGEELLTSYTNSKRARHERRAFLAEQYGFQCQCSVCSLPEAESQESDKRLEAISKAYERFSSWADGRISGAEAIALARRIWEIEEEEGYWSERGRLAADAVWVASSHSDAAAVRRWAKLAVEWYSYEIGADSDEVKEMQVVAQRPEKHSAWGAREELSVETPGQD